MKRSCRDGLVAFTLLGEMQSAAADEISDRNERFIRFAVDRKMPPPVAERPIAMMQVAMLDAVNRKYRLYLCSFRQKPRPPGKPRRQLPTLDWTRRRRWWRAATAAASVDVPAPTIEVLT